MAAERENEIGRCRCPVCSSTQARLRVSARQLAYVTCNACNSQTFGRSERSDELLRALHIKDAAPEPAPAQDVPPAAPTPPAPAPAPAFSWGIFR